MFQDIVWKVKYSLDHSTDLNLEYNGNQVETYRRLDSLMVPVFRDNLNLAKLKKPIQLVQEFKPNTDCYH